VLSAWSASLANRASWMSPNPDFGAASSMSASFLRVYGGADVAMITSGAVGTLTLKPSPGFVVSVGCVPSPELS
jgi:hypothetical protein